MGRQRVLIVDDDLDMAEVLAAMFEWLGHEARIALRRDDAIRILQDFTPQLVVLDLQLGASSGLDVAREICAVATRRPCLIAASGWNRPTDIARAREAGFDDYVVKPIHLENVRAMVRLATAHGERP